MRATGECIFDEQLCWYEWSLVYGTDWLCFRFYFASQVTEEGNPVRYEGVEAEAHGQVYAELIKGEVGKGDWDVRFAVGKDGSVSYQKS